MTLPCPICYEEHEETATMRCSCGGMVDCAGNEGNGFQVSCITCGQLLDARRMVIQEPALP